SFGGSIMRNPWLVRIDAQERCFRTENAAMEFVRDHLRAHPGNTATILSRRTQCRRSYSRETECQKKAARPRCTAEALDRAATKTSMTRSTLSKIRRVLFEFWTRELAAGR